MCCELCAIHQSEVAVIISTRGEVPVIFIFIIGGGCVGAGKCIRGTVVEVQSASLQTLLYGQHGLILFNPPRSVTNCMNSRWQT